MTKIRVRKGARLGTTVLRFVFDGREYVGVSGDSAASALLARGVKLLGRSVKYRRPRGVFAAGPEEPNALLTLGRAPALIPNVPASTLQLADDMQLQSQNRWPTLRIDLHSLLSVGSRFLGAGFYYKTFMWPSWRFYEGAIRQLAGLGPAPRACVMASPEVEHLNCDVLVAGAGPAGLAAALSAMRMGARVILCEREPQCGGELEFEAARIDGMPGTRWVADALAALIAGGVRVLTNTTVIGNAGQLIIAHQSPSLPVTDVTVLRIHARALVGATGGIEHSIAFVDNDRPGVMLLGAAERYLVRYGVHVGRRVVIFGNHDRLYSAARRLMDAGISVAAVIDSRPHHAGQSAAQDLAGIECLRGHVVVAAVGTFAVRGARVVARDASATARLIDCDAILVSGGWAPTPALALPQGFGTVAGAANGQLELAEILRDAHAAGIDAARRAISRSVDSPPLCPVGGGDAQPQIEAYWRSPASPTEEARQFVDLQNDVTVADLRQALDEGFTDIEHIKRYTTLGVGTEQGRTSGTLAAGIVAELSGRSVESVGISRSRMPLAPATLAALCGHRHGLALRPERLTPIHAWHLAHGAAMESMALWLRPRFYRANGDSPMAAGIAEAARVRAHGGILDGSTLGKIEVSGDEAAAFLDRLYLTKASTIRVGRSKYMVLLREDGMVLDDGIVMRLAADRFVATVSSGHAYHVLSHFEFWRQAEWSNRRVAITDVTESWGVIVVAGPSSRAALTAVLGLEWQLGLQDIAHMDVRCGVWRERELRVLRASFSGELAFELHCRPAVAVALWTELAAQGLQPYGLEALDILRVEKGYLVGSELNGQTTPGDLGLDGMLRLENPCIGRELLDRPGLQREDRPRLVGLRAVNRLSEFFSGAQLTLPAHPGIACGYVTSAVYSPACGQSIALALVSRAIPLDAELVARDPLRGKATPVRVTSPVHFDPGGERMKAS